MEKRASFADGRPLHVLDFAPLERLLSRVAPGGFDVSAMPGGASSRKYYRVSLHRGGTAVAMFVPHGEEAEEVQKGKVGGRWPFLEVAELLRDRGIDVPKVLAEATEDGWVLLEDLGEDTLAHYLDRHPEEREGLYRQAILDLARAQKSLETLPEGSIVGSRSFDEELLTWELQHFREWALEARGHTLSESERREWDKAAEYIGAEVTKLPQSFVHRDFQSRNLMVRHDGRLSWIDFQDALVGPTVYDVVALLNDSYQVFDRPFIERRLDDFARAQGLPDGERTALTRAFDLVTVQRKLKDAGRFVFIDRVRKNPSFLRFVIPTVQKAEDAIARLLPTMPELAPAARLVRRALEG